MMITTTGIPRAPLFVQILNPIIRGLLRFGLPLGPMALLTVRGRKTGQLHTTPVGLFRVGSRRFVFSTFGKVNWVWNLRADGGVVLTHGFRKKTYSAVELLPRDAAPVLRDVLGPYLASPFMAPMLRSWYGVAPEASLNDLTEVAANHPVFELREVHSS